MEQKLGATGKFPEGKITKEDEGEIQIGITTSRGNVIIDFGKPTHWVGLPKEQALAFAALITKRANEL